MKKKSLIMSALVLLSLGIAACNNQSAPGGNSNSNVPPTQSTSNGGGQGGGEGSENFSFTESELNTPQEIHTSAQLNYLGFTGKYYHITPSQLDTYGAKGDSNKSAPNKVAVSWSYEAPAGKTVRSFSFSYSQYADMSDAYTITGISASEQRASFYNPYLGDNYFTVTANLSDNSTEVSGVNVFKVTTQAPRNIYAGNMPNVRDMGGRTTYAGGKIKQGLIYRGAGNKFDKSTQINSECTDILKNQLKIKTEINVADSTTYNINLSGGKVENFYMAYGSTPYSNLSRNAEKIRQVMDFLSIESNYPIFYHCRIGTDRTGITGMMIGGLLGIPFNEIFQDYCFSNFSPIDGQRYANKADDPNGDDPAKYIDEIIKMPGANYQEKTYNALLAIGCDATKLNKIIDIMTEGNKATLPSSGLVGSNTALISTGTKKTASDYSNPAVYYETGSSKNTSYQVTTTAGEKDVVVYLGSTDSSKSTMLASCVSLKIDGADQSITNKSLFLAGFGRTTNAGNRTGYMFQILGKYTMTAASHTFQVAVKSGTFNIATICVFDHVASTETY